MIIEFSKQLRDSLECINYGLYLLVLQEKYDILMGSLLGFRT